MNQESTPLPTAQEALRELMALPGFPFGGPMFASDLCDHDEDGEPVNDDWGLEARTLIAACVNFVCEHGAALVASQGAGGGDWQDRLATLTDDLADWQGWIRLADGRVVGSRSINLHVRFNEPLYIAATPSEEPAQGEDAALVAAVMHNLFGWGCAAYACDPMDQVIHVDVVEKALSAAVAKATDREP